MTKPTTLSDTLRADAGLVLVGEWGTADDHGQRPAADAALDAWRDGTWPFGLLTHHCLLGEDSATLLHYQQWASSDACRALSPPDGPAGWKQ